MRRAPKDRECYCCGTKKSAVYEGYEKWYLNGDTGLALCKTCYDHLKRVPYPRAPKKYICYCCDATSSYRSPRKTKIQLWRPTFHEQWCPNYDKEGNALCLKCFTHLYPISTRFPMRVKEYSQRMICFKGKHRMLKTKPRIGVCNFCRAVRGEIDCQTDRLVKKTGMHHEEYDPLNPGAHVLEACNKCHNIADFERRVTEYLARLGTGIPILANVQLLPQPQLLINPVQYGRTSIKK